mmetsp:Transcript_3213/g.4896  ORF Transcript_3213/g.4896 Transcript_3213/m.4896 type:complete len:89 (-) Transcript_3213:636-902(-)
MGNQQLLVGDPSAHQIGYNPQELNFQHAPNDQFAGMGNIPGDGNLLNDKAFNATSRMNTTRKLMEQQQPIFHNKTEELNVKEVPSLLM